MTPTYEISAYVSSKKTQEVAKNLRDSPGLMRYILRIGQGDTQMTSKIYATVDADGRRIAEHASIAEFDTREEAEKYLLSAFDECDRSSFKITWGDFGDCWFKAIDNPAGKDWQFEPFTEDQVSIRRPGQHPGGNFYWVTPRPDVLVAVME